MFDGPRIFFELLLWIGWIVVAFGLYLVVSNLGAGGEVGRLSGFYLIGVGISWAGFCMIGKMIAAIGEELVALRQFVSVSKN